MTTTIALTAIALALLLACARADIILKLAIESWMYGRRERQARERQSE